MQNNNDIQENLLRYGIDLGFLLSGFFGALLLNIRNKKKTIGKSILCIAAGTLSANYLTPLILTLAPTSIQDRAKYAVAFMMGYMGLKGIEFVVDIFSDQFKNKKLKKND
jgi:hypothetical protein